MVVTLAVNSEALIARFYRDDADVGAIVGPDVYTTLPAGFDSWPALRVTRFTGSPAFNAPFVLDRPQLQVDAFANTKADARQLIDTVRAVSDERLAGVHPEGIVYSVTLGSVSWLPDETFDPAKPRYLCDLTLMTRSLT